jgi:hypothetical protein
MDRKRQEAETGRLAVLIRPCPFLSAVEVREMGRRPIIRVPESRVKMTSAKPLVPVGVLLLSLVAGGGCARGSGDRNTNSSSPPSKSTLDLSSNDLRDPPVYPEGDYCLAWGIVGRTERLPHFDASVTWTGKVGDPAENVTYYWNGQPVGKGEPGIREFIRRLGQTAMGSAALFYPKFITHPESNSFEWDPPNGDQLEEILTVMRQKAFHENQFRTGSSWDIADVELATT